ncbi:MAG: DUF805 domain-containing protein [Burkholderiaceae bacterium]|jgi:uncharacterized membrane protein YhaH (DUF805 family)|nr:DUF805 domain-containing protein [Burkholderiaceae bacterium]
MNILRHYTDAIFYHYADFKGRASRSAYWFFGLVYLVLAIAATLVDILVLGNLGAIMQGSWLTLVNAYCLVTLLPALAISTRRMHDIGQSGWLQLVYIVPTLALMLALYFIISVRFDDLVYLLVFVVIVFFAFIAGAIAFTVLAAMDSQKGRNQYGPNPKESGEAA